MSIIPETPWNFKNQPTSVEDAAESEQKSPSQLIIFFNISQSAKKTFIKALGRGLSIPLSDLDLSLGPEKLGKLVSAHEVLRHTAKWTIQDVSPAQECLAAFAVEGSGFTMKCWNGS
jgi:phosphopantetheinyl transferase